MDWAGYTKFVSFPVRKFFFWQPRSRAAKQWNKKNPKDAAPKKITDAGKMFFARRKKKKKTGA